MRKSRLPLLAAICTLFFCATHAFGGTCPTSTVYGFPNYSSTLGSLGVTNCYFIDMTSGSDSATGADESHPWRHVPEMANASGNAAAHKVTAGDGYIFKGGSVCGTACFPITAAASGTSSNPIYYGYDPSWGTGRPAFRPTGVISGANVIVSQGAGNTYRIWDNFDVSGLTDNGDNTFGHNLMFTMSGDHFTITRVYMHGWVVNGATNDDMVGIIGCNACSGGNQANSVVDSNYCNGADANPPSTSDGNGSFECLRYIAGGTISNNVIRNVSNAYVGGSSGATIYGNDWGNVYKSYDTANHENIMEFQDAGNVVYNNLYHDSPNAAWPMPLSPRAGKTDWIFNNVCWNVSRECVAIDTQSNLPTYNVNLINNTWIPKAGYVCAETTNRNYSYTIGTVQVINNHCITTNGTDASSFCFNQSSPVCSQVTTLVKTTNVLMSTSAATAQGYTSSELFVYSPTASINSTVGAGTNENSLASGKIAALSSDTSYACSVNGNNEVVCPARTAVSRGGSCTPTPGVPGCWDAGAHLFASGSAVLPPNNLQAVVQ